MLGLFFHCEGGGNCKAKPFFFFVFTLPVYRCHIGLQQRDISCSTFNCLTSDLGFSLYCDLFYARCLLYGKRVLVYFYFLR